MENENAVKESLDMIACQVRARISHCVEEADEYARDMNEDYEHFFCWHSEDMYKVQLRLKIYRELQKVVNGGSLCETLGWLNHTVGILRTTLYLARYNATTQMPHSTPPTCWNWR